MSKSANHFTYGDNHDHSHADHHDHDHSHTHDYKSLGRKKLLWSMGITFVVMIVEIVGGILSNSIALLSDAGHMFTHFFALLISYIAIRLASLDLCHHRTYGLYRAEVLASLFNGLFMLVVTGVIVYESIMRFITPEEIASREMFIVSVIGLVVNVITIVILEGSQRGDRNIRSAFMHMVADAVSSVGVVTGAIIIHFTGFLYVDPALGIMISVLICVWAWGLIKDSVRVLLEIVPKGMDTDIIKATLQKHDKRIVAIDDMHLFEITDGLYDLSATLTVASDSIEAAMDITGEAREILEKEFKIGHATIEVVK